MKMMETDQAMVNTNGQGASWCEFEQLQMKMMTLK